MKKKAPSKSKTISKSKTKTKTASAKKRSAKKSKPTAKKAAKKPAAKIKPAIKKGLAKSQKTKPKAAHKVILKKKEKPVSKSKVLIKPAAVKKSPPASISKKPAFKNNKQPVNTTPPPVQKEETASESPSKNITQQNRPSVGRPIPVNRRPEPARAIISNSKPQEETGKNRYSDKELEEFRDIINSKLTIARRELTNLQAQMTAANEHGTDDTASTFKILEDGSDSLAKEEAGQLASRQKKFIEQLENALVRIENKTYGICRVTGKLIPKERLRAVPHTTQSIEAKLNQYRE